jgi:hypothetical protein
MAYPISEFRGQSANGIERILFYSNNREAKKVTVKRYARLVTVYSKNDQPVVHQEKSY